MTARYSVMGKSVRGDKARARD